MLVVGVAGAISAGKSAVCGLLKEKGAIVVSADQIGHELTGAEPIRRRLSARFGEGILNEEGQIDRGKLGDIVFRDPQALADLDEIVHPPLIQAVRDIIAKMREGGSGVGVVDAALIPEWGIRNDFDVYVCVNAPRRKREVWYCKKTGKPKKDFDLRDQAQWSTEKKCRNADVVVNNDQAERDLEAKVATLWEILQDIEGSMIEGSMKDGSKKQDSPRAIL